MTDCNEGEEGRADRHAAREEIRLDHAPRINWTLIVTIVALVGAWLFSGFVDNRSMSGRVTALEVQRTSDTKAVEQQRDMDGRRMERIELKLDRLIEQTAARRDPQ